MTMPGVTLGELVWNTVDAGGWRGAGSVPPLDLEPQWDIGV